MQQATNRTTNRTTPMNTPSATATATATSFTSVAYAGGENAIAAKGGFLLPDGSKKYWVVCPEVKWRRVPQTVDADSGVEITITPDRPGWYKVTATCKGAVEAIR